MASRTTPVASVSALALPPQPPVSLTTKLSVAPVKNFCQINSPLQKEILNRRTLRVGLEFGYLPFEMTDKSGPVNQNCQKRASTKSAGLKSWRSLICSPTPMYLNGIFRLLVMATTIPPLAVPSSLVRARAVMPRASLNNLA